MIHDAVFYPQNRFGLPVFGGVILLHGIALFGLLNHSSTTIKPEMTAAAPLTVRWVTPVEEVKPAPVVEPQPVVEPEPEPEPLPPPEVKKPAPIKVKPKPKPIKKVKPVVKPVEKPVQPPKAKSVAPVAAPIQQTKPVPVNAQATPAPVEAPKFTADYLSNPSPVYPRRSRLLEEEGIVKFKVHVSAQGKALSLQMVKSSGFPRLDDAAFDVVKDWRFVPAKRGNQSIDGWVIVPVSFKLRS